MFTRSFRKSFLVLLLVCLVGFASTAVAAPPVTYENTRCNFTFTLPPDFAIVQNDPQQLGMIAVNPDSTASTMLSVHLGNTSRKFTAADVEAFLASMIPTLEQKGYTFVSRRIINNKPQGLISGELVVDVPADKDPTGKPVRLVNYCVFNTNYMVMMMYASTMDQFGKYKPVFEKSFASLKMPPQAIKQEK